MFTLSSEIKLNLLWSSPLKVGFWGELRYKLFRFRKISKIDIEIYYVFIYSFKSSLNYRVVYKLLYNADVQ